MAKIILFPRLKELKWKFFELVISIIYTFFGNFKKNRKEYFMLINAFFEFLNYLYDAIYGSKKV